MNQMMNKMERIKETQSGLREIKKVDENDNNKTPQNQTPLKKAASALATHRTHYRAARTNKKVKYNEKNSKKK